MSTTGLHPAPELVIPAVPVSPDRLAEFDRLMEAGGIEAVVEALRKENESSARPTRCP
jgi:hypothetical protein